MLVTTALLLLTATTVGLSSPTLAPHVGYPQDRWQQGCTNVSRLCKEIAAMGYPGSGSLLAQGVRPWRGPKPPQRPKQERRRAERVTRRTAMRWICLKPPEKLKAEEQVLLENLLSKDSELAWATICSSAFANS